MNSDGWGQGGAGTSDMRQGGEDLQHSMQYVRVKDAPNEMDLQHSLETEKRRHSHAIDHIGKHMSRHHSRPSDSQHGHDTGGYGYDQKHHF